MSAETIEVRLMVEVVEIVDMDLEEDEDVVNLVAGDVMEAEDNVVDENELAELL